MKLEGIYKSNVSGSKVTIMWREVERDYTVTIEPEDEPGVVINLPPDFVRGMIEEGTWEEAK